MIKTNGNCRTHFFHICYDLFLFIPTFSQFHTSDDGHVFDNVNTLENIMRTGTEFISEISAATIFTYFNLHIFRFSSFRFSGEGEVDVYRMCMCMSFIVSIPCHGIRSSRRQGASLPTNSPPRNHHATNQLAAK